MPRLFQRKFDPYNGNPKNDSSNANSSYWAGFHKAERLVFFLRKKRQISWISPKEETVSMQFGPAVACQVTSGEDTEENNIC